MGLRRLRRRNRVPDGAGVEGVVPALSQSPDRGEPTEISNAPSGSLTKFGVRATRIATTGVQRLRGAQRTSSPSSAAPGNVRVFTIHRSIVVRLGVAAAVLAALGIGFVAGLAISSIAPRTSAGKVVTDASVASVKSPSRQPEASPPAAPAAKLPTVLSCTTGVETPSATRDSLTLAVPVTSRCLDVTWSTWEEHGRWEWHVDREQLSTQLCRGNCQQLARRSWSFRIHSGGVFQDVLITPPSRSPHAAVELSPGFGVGLGVNVNLRSSPTGSGPGTPPLQTMRPATVGEAVGGGRRRDVPIAGCPPRRRLPVRLLVCEVLVLEGDCGAQRWSREAPLPRATDPRNHVPSCVSNGTTSFQNRSLPCRTTPSAFRDTGPSRNSAELIYRWTNRRNCRWGPPRVHLSFVVILCPLMMRIVSGVDWRESRSKT